MDFVLKCIIILFQMLRKMEQAKKKAESVVNTVDISEREKMAQLKRSVFASTRSLRNLTKSSLT